MLEHVVNDITHQMKTPIPASKIADAIKALGPETSIMSTDSGQVINPAPVCSMENFIREMLDHGVAEKAVMLIDRTIPPPCWAYKLRPCAIRLSAFEVSS